MLRRDFLVRARKGEQDRPKLLGNSRRPDGVASETSAAWGIVYVLFGWWGGLGALFVLGCLSQVLFMAVTVFTGKLRFIAATLFLYYSSFNGLFHNMGLDYWLTILLYISASAVTSLVLLYAAHTFLEGVLPSRAWRRTFLSLRRRVDET